MPNRQEIVDPLSLNLYTYAYNNPIKYQDPGGHVVETVLDVAGLAWSVYDMMDSPSLANAGFLAWDVAAILLPFVPGSYVAKGVKAASKEVKAVSSATVVKGSGVSNLGKTYGKFGTVVENPAIKITDFGTHAVDQAITRGVTTDIIKSTVNNPVAVLSQGNGSKFVYVSNQAVVVLDKTGKVITTYGKDYFDATVKQVLSEVAK